MPLFLSFVVVNSHNIVFHYSDLHASILRVHIRCRGYILENNLQIHLACLVITFHRRALFGLFIVHTNIIRRFLAATFRLFGLTLSLGRNCQSLWTKCGGILSVVVARSCQLWANIIVSNVKCSDFSCKKPDISIRNKCLTIKRKAIQF